MQTVTQGPKVNMALLLTGNRFEACYRFHPTLVEGCQKEIEFVATDPETGLEVAQLFFGTGNKKLVTINGHLFGHALAGASVETVSKEASPTGGTPFGNGPLKPGASDDRGALFGLEGLFFRVIMSRESPLLDKRCLRRNPPLIRFIFSYTQELLQREQERLRAEQNLQHVA